MCPRNSPNLIIDCLKPLYHSGIPFTDWLISRALLMKDYKPPCYSRVTSSSSVISYFSSSIALKLDFFSQTILPVSLTCWRNDVHDSGVKTSFKECQSAGPQALRVCWVSQVVVIHMLSSLGPSAAREATSIVRVLSCLRIILLFLGG